MLLLSLACSDYELKDATEDPVEGEDTGVVELWPDIRVDPASLDFGQVAVGEAASEVVTVENVGEVVLTLDEVVIELPGPFTVTNLAGESLEPGELGVVAVDYAPTVAGPHLAELAVRSDDPDEPEVLVPLSGETLGPVIELDPWSHDFGELEPGQVELAAIGIGNVGDADLALDELLFSATTAELALYDDGGVVPGEVLAPGERVEVTVSFAPADEGMEEGSLVVWSDDPATPEVSSTVVGTGIPVSSIEHEVVLDITVDDAWEGYLDGEALEASGAGAWNSFDTLSFTLETGEHVIAVHGRDVAAAISGLISVLQVDGAITHMSGDGSWLMTATDPGTGWEELAFDDSGWSAPAICSSTSPWGTTPSSFYSLGAQWVWWTSDCTDLGEAWFRLRFTLD